ncbi:MAG: flavodoxin domain-containing protein [Anaerolineae bacterium]
MKVVILFNSQKGHTQAAAEAMAQAARDEGHEVTIKAVSQNRASDIEQADVVLIGTWVQGFILFGVKPAHATLWVPALPSLQGKRVATFCTYRFNPRGSLKKLGEMLEGRGATLVGQQAFQRDQAVQGAEPFVRQVLQAVEKRASS